MNQQARKLFDGVRERFHWQSSVPKGIGVFGDAVKPTGLWMRQADFDWGKMAQHAYKLGRGAVAQRLGYLLELLELGTPSLIDNLQEMVTARYDLLDSLLPDDGRYLARWRLRLNLEPETLQVIVRT